MASSRSSAAISPNWRMRTSLALGSAICETHGSVAFALKNKVGGIKSLIPHRISSRFRISANSTAMVPCGPLGAWLGLLGVTRLDFFSLDAEGAELLVLQTIDWSALSVGVLITECGPGPGCASSQDKKVGELLTARGLEWAASLRVRHDLWDAVYVNRSYTVSISICP